MCESCGKPKCACGKDTCSSGAAVVIKNATEYVNFRKVLVPASVRSDETNPPKNGEYCNTLLVFEATGNAYLYSSDSVATQISDRADIRRLERLIEAEATTREDEDKKLDKAIKDEADIREDEDKKLDKAIKDEADTRSAADQEIWTEIETIEASSDVVDVVGTYAELQAYDTSKLHDKDLIKVLQDETRDDAITYYRWSTSTDTFTYVGAEGPYYTVSETDTLLAGKVNTSDVTHTPAANYAAAAENKVMSQKGVYLQVHDASNNIEIGCAGVAADARGTGDIAIGNSAIAAGDNDIAIGNSGLTTAVDSGTQTANNIAIGHGSVKANGGGATAIGYGSISATGLGATAIGFGGITASGNYSTAIGNSAVTASAINATAVGSGATTASGTSSVAVGSGVRATNNGSAAFGCSGGNGQITEATGSYGTSVGYWAKASGDYSAAVGYNVAAGGDYSAAFGSSGVSVADDSSCSVAIGASGVTAYDSYNVAIGTSGAFAGNSSAATSSSYNYAFGGQGVNAYGGNSVAIGTMGTTASGTRSIAIGHNGATASHTDSVALGSSSVTGRTLEVSLGKDASGSTPEVTKYIAHVTAGVNNTDAVNVAQLNAAIPGVMTGATAQQAGSAGLVPAPTTSDPEKFLKGDGTWGTPIGKVYTAGTHIDISNADVISVTDMPVLYTTSGNNEDGAVTQKYFTEIVGDVETILQTLNSGAGVQ